MYVEEQWLLNFFINYKSCASDAVSQGIEFIPLSYHRIPPAIFVKTDRGKQIENAVLFPLCPVKKRAKEKKISKIL